MQVSIIVAMAHNRCIGRDGTLPWRLSADLKRFKQITMGKPILMGRKTYASIGKPLPGRTNIVITRDATYDAPGCTVVHSLEDALALATEEGAEEAMVIGGAEIYALALPQTNCIYLTEVDTEVEGDAFFPALDNTAWNTCEEIVVAADDRNEFATAFRKLERKPR